MIRPGSSVTKAKVKNNLANLGAANKPKKSSLPSWQDFLKERDWNGAIALLELDKSMNNMDNRLWLAYCYFHAGEYKRATNIYDELMKKPDYDKNFHIFKGCCHYALTNYEEARKEASKGPECPLQIRLLYHIAQKKGDETSVMNFHYKLTDSLQDQFCFAAINYLRGFYEEAIDVYKKQSLDFKNNDTAAAAVYCALCYYKQDYYEICLDMLNVYLKDHPDSVFVNNLKACTSFQLYQGKVAENEFKAIEKLYQGGNIYEDYDLLRHNLCVFKEGENALQVFPPLIDLFPEARLNLVVYYLRNSMFEEAQNHIKDLDPFAPREYILKAVVYAIVGQLKNNSQYVNQAMQLFQMVGTSANECDTIAGRQCVASYLFLKKQFENVHLYLSTIKEHMGKSDNDFNWNHGIACACVGKWEEAEESLMRVEDEKYKNEFVYLSWLSRVFIMNGRPEQAWRLYMEMDTSNDAIKLLRYIANDCYRRGIFTYALKCFDLLLRLDSDQSGQYYMAKIGAAVGVFQMAIVRKATRDQFDEMMQSLAPMARDPEVDHIIRTMRKWAMDNKY